MRADSEHHEDEHHSYITYIPDIPHNVEDLREHMFNHFKEHYNNDQFKRDFEALYNKDDYKKIYYFDDKYGLLTKVSEYY